MALAQQAFCAFEPALHDITLRPRRELDTGRDREAVIRAPLIVLVDNNMLGRGIHGMIALGGRSEEVRK